MIIWSGLGFLVAVIVFGTCLVAQLLIDNQLGAGFYSSHLWCVGAALAIGGLLSAVVGFALKSRSDRFVVDEDTGERLFINQSNHTFFFVPMHWAGILVAAIGAGLAAWEFVN